jgi:DNA processing protein
MKFSEIALKVIHARDCGLIKSNAHFWKTFPTEGAFINNAPEGAGAEGIINARSEKLNSMNVDGFVCAFDDEFPAAVRSIKNNSEKPYLLFYKGDISLLSDLNKNVAVVGVIDHDEEIASRETQIITELVKNEMVIISGLALGCDTIAHRVCLDNNGKTIAVLPSRVDKVYPGKNNALAEEIVRSGGLLLSEYNDEPRSRHEAVKRFIDRDRLQAMFAKAVILIASYRKGCGDSGSRFAMEAAKKYGRARYIMYNSDNDKNKSKFGLNRELFDSGDAVEILSETSISAVGLLVNSTTDTAADYYVQQSLMPEGTL